jgi:hypothetical protein
MAITIRNTGIQAGSASSYVVTWPSGTVANDIAVITAGHGAVISTPSGWNLINSMTGTIWNGAAFWRTLTSADILAGSVTVSAASATNGVVAITTIVGGFTPTFVGTFSRNSTGSASIVAPAVTVTGADTLAIYFGSNHGASTDTISRGLLQQQANDTVAASGALYTENFSATTASFSPTMSYSVAGTGNYQGSITLISIDGIHVSKAVSYAVLGPPVGVAISKLNSYMVIETPRTPVWAPFTIPSGTVGTSYTLNFSAAGSPTITYTNPSGSLPTGLSLSGSTISGTPTVAGSYTFVLRATNIWGSADLSVTILINSASAGGGVSLFVF